MSEDDKWNEEFELNYKIGEDAPVEYFNFEESDPENNAILTSLSSIETTWSESIEKIDENMVVTVYDGDDAKVTDMNVTKSPFSYIIILSLDSPIEKDGDYRIVIPEGLLMTSNGAVSEAVELNYTVDSTTATSGITAGNEIETEGNRIISRSQGMLAIYNVYGSLVDEISGNGETSVEPGIYIVVLNDDNQRRSAKIMIK